MPVGPHLETDGQIKHHPSMILPPLTYKRDSSACTIPSGYRSHDARQITPRTTAHGAGSCKQSSVPLQQQLKQANSPSQVTRRDLKNLCEVSKNIYVKMVPCLYESLVIKATYPSAQSVNDAITRSNHSQLVHTKHLRLWGSYHEIEAYQFCSLHDFLDGRLQAPGDVDGPMSKIILCGDQQTTTFDCIPIMTHNMYRMVSGIPQGQLQSFQYRY